MADVILVGYLGRAAGARRQCSTFRYKGFFYFSFRSAIESTLILILKYLIMCLKVNKYQFWHLKGCVGVSIIFIFNYNKKNIIQRPLDKWFHMWYTRLPSRSSHSIRACLSSRQLLLLCLGQNDNHFRATNASSRSWCISLCDYDSTTNGDN